MSRVWQNSSSIIDAEYVCAALLFGSYGTQLQTPISDFFYQSASSASVSIRKLTGRKPSLHEIIADFLFFIQPL